MSPVIRRDARDTFTEVRVSRQVLRQQEKRGQERAEDRGGGAEGDSFINQSTDSPRMQLKNH